MRRDALAFREVLAQSIAMLGPTLTPVLIVPLMASSAGNASWLAYALGSVLLLAVAFAIRAFATRSASPGSLYAYAERAFGSRGGLLCGWVLLWAYACVGVAGLTGFAVFAETLGHGLGIGGPLLRIGAAFVCLTAAFGFAYRDVRLSTETLLWLEAGSVTLVSALLALVVVHEKTVVDPLQLHLRGATPSGIALGMTIAIFSLVGFESATALGAEAREPLRTIPAAVIASVIISGAFFVVCAYVEGLGAHRAGAVLANLGTPLDALSARTGVVQLGVAIDIGALLSSFSITLAALGAAARVLYAMAHRGLFPRALRRTHPAFETPDASLAATALLFGAIGLGALFAGIAPIDAFNDTATLGSFGFVAIYLFVALGAPFYLRSRGELRRRDTALAIVTVVLLAIPAVASVYPAPPPPANIFPYVFAAYAIVGAVFVMRSPIGEFVMND